jgi:hypothetical protein
MMVILEDGVPHELAELKACCGPCSPRSVREAIKRLNKALGMYGLRVVAVARGYGRPALWALYRTVGR